MTTPSLRSAKPFDDIRTLLADLPDPHEHMIEAAIARQGQLVKPVGSLGRLEDIAIWLAGWQGRIPRIDRPLIAIFASSHGVSARGVSAYPPEVTRIVVDTIAAGGAAISQLAQFGGAGLDVLDLAIDAPTPDIAETDAMSERETVATMAFGMEVLAKGTDCLILGEVGIGNTTIAAAICHALYGGSAESWVGAGTGVTGAALDIKIETVRCAVARLGPGPLDPLEVLSAVGGREIAACAGAILAARQQRIPIILDGYVICAAAAVLHAINPRALDHCIAGHVSAEAGHRSLLDRLGKKPLLDLGLRLGEGTGAALALQIVRAAVACHTGMATMDQVGIEAAH
jgi:nicotinate-nucleotide--dimethylbenzimidazole phosphoribosyltransferase